MQNLPVFQRRNRISQGSLQNFPTARSATTESANLIIPIKINKLTKTLIYSITKNENGH